MSDGPAPSDLLDWHEPKQLTRCQCGDDLPGICPGPANCPYNRSEEQEPEDE
jgi:hypothetical protein